MSTHVKKHPVALSVGLLVGEDRTPVGETLESLFRQSVFDRLGARHEQCEVIVVTHAANAEAVTAARSACDAMLRRQPWFDPSSLRVIEIPEAGRAQAWNRFVHEFSAIEARYLCVMEPGIGFHHRDTIHNLMASLERRPHLPASTARPVPTLILKERRTLGERFAIAQSAFAAEAGGLSAQLYCLKATVARNLHVPSDLVGGEVDFVNEIVRSDFFMREPSPLRIQVAPEAAFLCAPQAFLVRLRRRIVAQTTQHVLRRYLKTLAWDDRINLADTLRRHESRDPNWFKKLVATHLRRCGVSWRLYPGLMTQCFRQLWLSSGARKLSQLPIACLGTAAVLNAASGALGDLQQWAAPCLAAIDATADTAVPQFDANQH